MYVVKLVIYSTCIYYIFIIWSYYDVKNIFRHCVTPMKALLKYIFVNMLVMGFGNIFTTEVVLK